MIEQPFGELEVGQTKISKGRTITETDIVQFAMLSGAWLELQTNDEFAKHTIYGKRIAQGPLIFSIATIQLGHDGELLEALYGVDRMRMVKPVFVGDTLWSKGEILDLQDKGAKHGLVRVRLEAINQRDEVVMSCELLLLIRKERLRSPVGPGRHS